MVILGRVVECHVPFETRSGQCRDVSFVVVWGTSSDGLGGKKHK